MSDHRALLQDPEFREVARRRNRIAAVLTALTLVVYFGFIFLLAFDPKLFGRKVTAKITLGIPAGIGVIVLSWVFTGIYVRWANSRYDAMVRNLRNRIENADRGPG